MQRFLNDPDDVVDETVRGFVKAHGAIVRLHYGYQSYTGVNIAQSWW